MVDKFGPKLIGKKQPVTFGQQQCLNNWLVSYAEYNRTFHENEIPCLPNVLNI